MRRSASVLVEVLAVLFVAGLLAAVAIPDFDGARPNVRFKTMITSLETVRSAVSKYWADHDAVYPGLAEMNALTTSGRIKKTKTGMAAYLPRIPINPFTGLDVVGPADSDVGTTDWIYDPNTGVFKANHSAEHRAL